MPAIPLIVASSIVASVLFGWNSWISLKLINTSEDLVVVKTKVTALDDNFTEYIVKPALQNRQTKDLVARKVATSTDFHE